MFQERSHSIDRLTCLVQSDAGSSRCHTLISTERRTHCTQSSCVLCYCQNSEAVSMLKVDRQTGSTRTTGLTVRELMMPCSVAVSKAEVASSQMSKRGALHDTKTFDCESHYTGCLTVLISPTTVMQHCQRAAHMNRLSNINSSRSWYRCQAACAGTVKSAVTPPT